MKEEKQKDDVIEINDEKQEENVIEIKDLVKKYKMYNRKQDRLIETIFPKTNCVTIRYFCLALNINLQYWTFMKR